MSSHIILPSADDRARLVTPNEPGVIFRQAARYRIGRPNKLGVLQCGVFWIVIHSAECSETASAAEALASYAAHMPPDRSASWHYAVDADSTTQSVREKDTAWHAPPLNPYSIGIEQAGRAKQLESEWNDAYSLALIEGQLVPLVARICARHRILPRLVSDDLLREGLDQASRARDVAARDMVRKLYSGVITHSQISRVFKKSDHTDPGAHFPLEAFVRQVVERIDPVVLMSMGALPPSGSGVRSSDGDGGGGLV
jgi:hypothetical protein